MNRSLIAALWMLTISQAVVLAQSVDPVWKVAKARDVVPGAPKYSDVIVRNLRPHPVPNRPDPYDTVQMLGDFHVTRLDWTYSLTRPFIDRVKMLGVSVGGALENDESDVNGSKNFGRATDKEGHLKSTSWFKAGRWVGCPNAPEYRAAWLYHAKLNVDAGVDLLQQDDPALTLQTNPPLCYCKYCREAFTKYQQSHGADSTYEQFQKDSVLAFHKEMHRELDAYAGRHIPFSSNDWFAFNGKPSVTGTAFDYVNCEMDPKSTEPSKFYRGVLTAHGIPMVFSYRDTSLAGNRRFLALSYATGTWMMMPWDVYLPHDAPRYFGKVEDYADLSGFVRANTEFLDGYEEAAAIGKGIHDARYGADAPLSIEGGSGKAYAFVRARPGNDKAPIVIHVVEWADEAKPLTLRLNAAGFGRHLSAVLRTPTSYDADAHKKAQATGDFRSLVHENALEATSAGDDTVITMPAMNPWGIVVVRSANR